MSVTVQWCFLTEYTEGDGRGLPMVEFTSENIATRNAVRPQINAFLIKALISEFDKTASGDEENDALRTEFLNVSSPRSEVNYERRKSRGRACCTRRDRNGILIGRSEMKVICLRIVLQEQDWLYKEIW